MQLTTDQIDAIRKKFHPDDMPSRLLVRSIAEFLVELLAAHNAGAQEPVAEIVRWLDFTNKPCFDIKVIDKTLEHGAKLYTQPQPIPQTDAARDALGEAALWLHAAYDRPPQSPESKAMLARIDAEIERIDRAKGE